MLTTFFITLHIGSFAQMETSFIAGVNMATQFEKGGRQSSDVSIESAPGFNIGFAASVNVIDQFYIDGSFLFEQKGANREEVIPLASSTITNTNDVRLYYATVPFRAQYRVSFSEESFLMIGAGFYGSMGILGRGTYTTESNDVERTRDYKLDWWSSEAKRNDEFSNLDFGLTTQVGLKIKRIRIELNYDHGVRNISSAPTREYRRFNQTLRLSLGYAFEW